MSNQNEESQPAPFLTDVEDVDDNVKYVKPNIETKLSARKRRECRDIVQEIRNFGISQRQLLYLIYLLSLELENREVMTALSELIGKYREKIPVSTNLILPDDE